jgi:hypothetical protein
MGGQKTKTCSRAVNEASDLQIAFVSDESHVFVPWVVHVLVQVANISGPFRVTLHNEKSSTDPY